MRIHADHVLRGYEAVATRLMQTVAAATTERSRGAAARLAPRTRRRGAARDRSPAPPPLPGRAVPPAVRVHRRATAPDPGEPDRRGGAADRPLRDADELDAELAESPDALVADGLGRVAWGEVAELRWQLGTFGFHLASLEIRQHSAVHRAALAAIRARRPGPTELAPGVTLDEVLATFRAIAAAQARFGADACHRYVVSFTASAARRHRRPRARPPRGGRDGDGEALRRPSSMSSRSSSPSMRCGGRADPGALLVDPAYRAASRRAATARR